MLRWGTQGLREHSVVLMGKNTMMKRCIRLYCERTGDDKWAPMLDALVGNVGMIFTKVSCQLPVHGGSAAVWPGQGAWRWRACRLLQAPSCMHAAQLRWLAGADDRMNDFEHRLSRRAG